MSRLALVHLVPSVDPASGGPAHSVPALCRHLPMHGVDATLVTLDRPARALPEGLPADTRFVSAGRWRRSRELRRALRAALERTPGALLHDHGLWLPAHHVACALARRLGVLRVVSPRGMLEPWALAWHGRRKRLAWWLYQRRDLEQAHLLHATSEAEAEGLRRLGFTQPIAVIPNGVDALACGSAASRAQAPRVALFLSRLHPKKGLPDLVAAWAQVRPAGWELWIAGPDEEGHEARIRAAAAAAGVAACVRFLGPLEGAPKQDTLARAQLFVLPTLSENFGLVVAEALAAGMPVLTTHAAPWSELETVRAGWWVPTGPEALARALASACATPASELAEMGARGRALVAARYLWPGLAGRMAAVYRWLAAGGPPPPDVRLVPGR